MSSPLSPPTLKAGIILLDPVTTQLARIVVLQYNPDQLTRTLQVQATSGESGDRSEALRLKGPPVETFKLEAEIDATDQLETAEPNYTVVDVGIFPQLAALESLITPSSAQLYEADALLRAGAVEIAPMEAPLALFVWSTQRVVPVRITEFSITEEAFDVALNPIRAKVSLGMRVLSVNDLGFDHRGGKLFMAYLKNKEALAQRECSGSLEQLGLKALP
ncbi:hypothetical protein [Azotobacter chroococcum]|uniref:hypothetical protein n=1 Tax=Azotobacter chroococcum TaxID=353 RepID=UPI0010AEBCE7|nr:hypothetical protein [Azotobacter chroococcum]TKD47383.1 hypothetical protein FCG41_00035 [Azotobacter chroococcum]